MTIIFSDSQSISVTRIGVEQQAIIVIDNAFATIEDVRALAIAQPYTRIGPYFPGERAALAPTQCDDLADHVMNHARAHLSVGANRLVGDAYFSVVTTAPGALLPIQRMPHYDGTESDQLAVLAYLSSEDFGGTAFFRHRQTGFETVTTERFEPFRSALENEVRHHGLPPARYADADNPYFEKIHEIEPRFNRMLIYRGASLHCSAINNATPLPTDPAKGRLTLNGFFKSVSSTPPQQVSFH